MLHKSDYSSVGVPIINPINIIGESIVPDVDKQIGLTTLSRLSNYVLKAGDVVVGRRGEIGRCAVIGMNEAGWICGTGCFFIRPGSGIDSNFLAWMLRSPSYRTQLERASTGATMKNLSNTALAQLPVLIPAIKEQRRIVAILAEAFEGIATAKANAEKNLQNARDWSGRRLTAILELESQGGCTDTLEALVASDCSLSYGIVQPGEDVPSGLPIVRPVDLGPKTVGVSGLKRIDPALARSYARTTLKGDDLLLCVRGTTGTVAIAESALAGANVTRGIVPIRFDPEFLVQELGYYLLRSDPVQAQIRAKTYGAALMQINIGDLRQIVLSIPPLNRQLQTLEKLDVVQELANQLAMIYQGKLMALDELKKSLLHQAFTGQL